MAQTANEEVRMSSICIEGWRWLCSGIHSFSQSKYTRALVCMHSSVKGVLGSKASMLSSFTSQLVRLILICCMNSLNECSVRIHSSYWYMYMLWMEGLSFECGFIAERYRFKNSSAGANSMHIVYSFHAIVTSRTSTTQFRWQKWGKHRKNLFLYLRCAIRF